MKDVIIYTDSARFVVTDNALYEHGVHGFKGLIFEIESFVRMDDGSVIVRGEDFNVCGLKRMISLGIVTDMFEARTTVQ